MSEVEQPLNLLSLARSGAGTPQLVPGTRSEVVLIDDKRSEPDEGARWLLLIAGELIVDLPHNDFRLLRAGDGLHLPAGIAVSFQAVEPAVVLKSPL